MNQVAHEIRTPINCIILLIEMALQQVPDRLKEKYLLPAYSSAKLLNSLVNDMLDIA